MFRARDSVGLPAEMRLYRKSFQCEHFLKCFSVIVDAAQENGVDVQAVRLDHAGGIALRLVPLQQQVEPKELTLHVEGNRTVPVRRQNKRSTVHTTYLFSDDQGSIHAYQATFYTLIFPTYADTDSYKEWNEYMLISRHTLEVSLSFLKCVQY